MTAIVPDIVSLTPHTLPGALEIKGLSKDYSLKGQRLPVLDGIERAVRGHLDEISALVQSAAAA